MVYIRNSRARFRQPRLRFGGGILSRRQAAPQREPLSLCYCTVTLNVAVVVVALEPPFAVRRTVYAPAVVPTGVDATGAGDVVDGVPPPAQPTMSMRAVVASSSELVWIPRDLERRRGRHTIRSAATMAVAALPLGWFFACGCPVATACGSVVEIVSMLVALAPAANGKVEFENPQVGV